MNLQDRFSIQYIDNNLILQGISVEKLYKKYGSPIYLYSQEILIKNYNEYYQIMTKFFGNKFLICQAIKANMSNNLIKVLSPYNVGADVTSKGEIFIAISGGVDPDRIVYSGVGKQADEIEFAIVSNIRQFNVESVPEFKKISQIAAKLNKKVNIALRLNLDVVSDTDAKIATGSSDTKFGLDEESTKEIIRLSKGDANIDINGLAVHIGSQITNLECFRNAFIEFKKMYDFYKTQINITSLDFGGGLGISYDIAQDNPSKSDYLMIIKELFGSEDVTIIIEPGRSLVADCGFLLSKVLYIKENYHKKFAILDLGMNDLLRPAMYGAKHEMLPVRIHNNGDDFYNFVGPICETSDKFADNKKFQILKEDDLILFMCCGAYGASMSSFYNARSLIKQILIADGQDIVISEEINPFK